ncbi:hypothetical protein [Halopseudomonas xiamenensis]|uniref:hypothetical protein n=1 Tax=Halopseudomonas xiamenensis TaxID=157792 RepID=UPI00162587F2|nr:hypothetical protein [Halopseudomonas xiamenensis]
MSTKRGFSRVFMRVAMVGVTSWILVIFLGLLIVYVGSHLAGGLDEYGQMMLSAAPALLVWRLLLYATAVALWLGRFRMQAVQWLMRDENGGHEGLRQLKRLEYAAVAFVLLIELYNLAAAWGQA